MKKVFFNIYLFYTAICILGCMITLVNIKMKESIIYMFLAISAGCITAMLKPRTNIKQQEQVEIKALIILLITIISAAVLIVKIA